MATNNTAIHIPGLNEALLALTTALNGAAINGPAERPYFREAMKIYNRDWADKIDAPRALDKWEVSEMACLRFTLMRHEDREKYFKSFGHYNNDTLPPPRRGNSKAFRLG
ncbi:hypothetical protein QBC39DRAFT_372774 [Podospora conica]|nr:hypothetical protein QBC39DRAFT_372774 [Schizothecium conicum]